MKILILSNSEWDDNNSFGNTFSNIFGGMKNVEIANIYCRSNPPNTNSCSRFFQITEKTLIKNRIAPKVPSGFEVCQDNLNCANRPDTFNEKQLKFVDFIKIKRWVILFWIRDFIWLFGKWKSSQLKKFIDDFQPDLIFLPIYYSTYLNKIGLFLKAYTNKPMVGNVSDDVYTLRQYSLSPFYWIDRFLKRRWVKKAVDQCEILYVISDIQKQDYDLSFNKECKLLYKGGIFNEKPTFKHYDRDNIKLVYTGNLHAGRYLMLANIGKVLDETNLKNDSNIQLYIYTQTLLSNKMKIALDKKSIVFHGAVPFSEIRKIQNDADILVHAESFNLKEKLLVRQSFSTKIVDYFQAARCIFAIGWEDAASIKYLIKNDAAVVATNKKEIEKKLINLVNNPTLINDYAGKGWECGKRNHDINLIRKNLLDDFNYLIN